MALTERFENDKIEVVGQYKIVQVRELILLREMVSKLLDHLIVILSNQEH